MNKKSLAGAIAVVAGILAAATAHADVLPSTTPFVDPGCLCAGLLPGRVAMGVDSQSPFGAHYISGNLNPDNNAAAAEVRYWHLPSSRVTLQAIATGVEKDTGSVQYGTYRGRPSFTTSMAGDDTDGYAVETLFIDGDRAFLLLGAGGTPADAQGALDALSASFQLL